MHETKVLWKYEVICEICFSPELGKYRTYGIQALEKSEQGWNVVKTIHDVSPDKKTAEKIADLFTQCQLSLIHFRDAVEDIIL